MLSDNLQTFTVMKRILMLFRAGVLISALCAGFVACHEPNGTEQKERIEPVPVNQIGNEVNDYLNKNAGRIAQSAFGLPDESNLTDRCAMINSLEEMPELTFIDFNSHTLVIGQYVTGGARYLSSQNLVAEQDSVTLNITVENPGGLQSSDVRVDYFWALYPKIEAKQIGINVIRK